MGSDTPQPMDAFEAWFLRRVVQAVEAGDVPKPMLTELQANLAATEASVAPWIPCRRAGQ